ncbi:MAG: hypothetical protein ACTSYD_12300 [Candidatus Heimdallarchaeaceae archaeon]
MGSNRIKKLWTITAITYYIFFILLTFPPRLLLQFTANTIRRSIALSALRSQLKKEKVPRKLRREIIKTYKNSLKTFSVFNLAKKAKKAKKKE